MRRDFLILNCTLIYYKTIPINSRVFSLLFLISSMSGLKRRTFVDISNHSLTGII